MYSDVIGERQNSVPRPWVWGHVRDFSHRGTVRREPQESQCSQFVQQFLRPEQNPAEPRMVFERQREIDRSRPGCSWRRCVCMPWVMSTLTDEISQEICHHVSIASCMFGYHIYMPYCLLTFSLLMLVFCKRRKFVFVCPCYFEAFDATFCPTRGWWRRDSSCRMRRMQMCIECQSCKKGMVWSKKDPIFLCLKFERRKICRTQSGKWRLKTNESLVLKFPFFQKEFPPAEIVELGTRKFTHGSTITTMMWRGWTTCGKRPDAKLLSLKIFESVCLGIV